MVRQSRTIDQRQLDLVARNLESLAELTWHVHPAIGRQCDPDEAMAFLRNIRTINDYLNTLTSHVIKSITVDTGPDCPF